MNDERRQFDQSMRWRRIFYQSSFGGPGHVWFENGEHCAALAVDMFQGVDLPVNFKERTNDE